MPPVLPHGQPQQWSLQIAGVLRNHPRQSQNIRTVGSSPFYFPDRAGKCNRRKYVCLIDDFIETFYEASEIQVSESGKSILFYGWGRGWGAKSRWENLELRRRFKWTFFLNFSRFVEFFCVDPLMGTKRNVFCVYGNWFVDCFGFNLEFVPKHELFCDNELSKDFVLS